MRMENECNKDQDLTLPPLKLDWTTESPFRISHEMMKPSLSSFDIERDLNGTLRSGLLLDDSNPPFGYSEALPVVGKLVESGENVTKKGCPFGCGLVESGLTGIQGTKRFYSMTFVESSGFVYCFDSSTGTQCRFLSRGVTLSGALKRFTSLLTSRRMNGTLTSLMLPLSLDESNTTLSIQNPHLKTTP